MTDEIIRVEKLTKTWGTTRAVAGISFAIARGTIVSILGPNGAGKTTTLECIEGMIKPDSGRIEIPTGSIGIQLQSSALPEALTINEAMQLFCGYRKVPMRNDLIERFGLKTKERTQFSRLSTGQQRKLALALAVIHNPQILFLDEPSAGLDVGSRNELHRIIRELKDEGTTIIMATHDMAEAESLSDRVIILLNGSIAAEGTALELTAESGAYSRISVKTENNSLQKLLKSIPCIQKKHGEDDYLIFFSEDAGITASYILNLLKENSDKLIDFRIERPSLEERFIEITGAAV